MCRVTIISARLVVGLAIRRSRSTMKDSKMSCRAPARSYMAVRERSPSGGGVAAREVVVAR